MGPTKRETETGIIDLEGVADADLVVLKVRTGYCFHHPNGTKLERREVKGQDPIVLLHAQNGGSTRVPKDSPFISVPAAAVRGQEYKFDRPTEEELMALRMKTVKDLAPPASLAPMVALGLEDKQLDAAPEDKEIKGRGRK